MIMLKVMAAFADDVRKMRAAQKAYFKTRTREALILSKTAEKVVDEALILLEQQNPKEETPR